MSRSKTNRESVSDLNFLKIRHNKALIEGSTLALRNLISGKFRLHHRTCSRERRTNLFLQALEERVLLSPPTARVADVSPNPRNTGVDSIAIVFSEPVKGFGFANLLLARDGGGNLLTTAQTLRTNDQINWALENLAGPTGSSGTYQLQLTNIAGITNAAGEPLAGDPDFAVTLNNNSNIELERGNGDATFTPRPLVDTFGGSPEAIAHGDIYGDHIPDLVVTIQGVNKVGVYRGLGGGRFDAPSFYAVGGIPLNVKLGDLNGDGYDDIVTANLDNSVTVLLNDGTGHFDPASRTDYITPDRAKDVVLGDFDQAGGLDLAVSVEGQGVMVFYNTNKSGDFSNPQNQMLFPANAVSGLAVRDIDKDGRLDIVSLGLDSLSVLYGAPGRSFNRVDTSLGSDTPTAIAIGDVTNDGLPDLLYINQAARNLKVLKNGGGRGFSLQQTLDTLQVPNDVEVGDFNRDGLSDVLVVTDNDQSRPTVLLFRANSNGSGLSGPAFVGAAAGSAKGVTVGELDDLTRLTTFTVVNTPPTASDDSFITPQNMPLNQAAPGVLVNDTSPAGTQLTALTVASPANGALVLRPNGSFTYTPNSGFHGIDHFTYEDNDGRANSNVASVTITVTVPGELAPIANPVSAPTAEDTAVVIPLLVNSYDPDGDPITIGGLSPLSNNGGSVVNNGNGTATYTPAANFNGSDSFMFTVSDGRSGTSTASAFVNISEVNDPPLANSDSKSVNEGSSLTFAATDLLANDTPGPPNEGGQTLTVIRVGPGAHGSVVLNADGTITYRPDTLFNGTDSFPYTVQDNGTTKGSPDPKQTTAIVTIAVIPADPATRQREQRIDGIAANVLKTSNDPRIRRIRKILSDKQTQDLISAVVDILSPLNSGLSTNNHQAAVTSIKQYLVAYAGPLGSLPIHASRSRFLLGAKANSMKVATGADTLFGDKPPHTRFPGPTFDQDKSTFVSYLRNGEPNFTSGPPSRPDILAALSDRFFSGAGGTYRFDDGTPLSGLVKSSIQFRDSVAATDNQLRKVLLSQVSRGNSIDNTAFPRFDIKDITFDPVDMYPNVFLLHNTDQTLVIAIGGTHGIFVYASNFAASYDFATQAVNYSLDLSYEIHDVFGVNHGNNYGVIGYAFPHAANWVQAFYDLQHTYKNRDGSVPARPFQTSITVNTTISGTVLLGHGSGPGTGVA